MELSDLEVFRAVVESGGVIKAAERLHRVPSNITARIQKLEQNLKVSLFHRDRNRLHLSIEGERLLGYTHQLMALADEARRAVTGQQLSGELRLGSMESTAAVRLPPLLTDFHHKFDAISLVLSTGPTGLLIDQVLAGEIDLAFVADPVEDERLQRRPVFSETLVIVGPSGLALNDASTLLAFNAQCAYRQCAVAWLKSMKHQARVIEIASYHALLSCALAGMGIGIVPQSLLADYPYADRLQCLELPAAFRNSTTHLIWRKDRANGLVDAFVEFMSFPRAITDT